MSPQYGELRPTSGWDRFGSLGYPCKFQLVSRLGSVTARHLVVGVSQTLWRWTEGATYIRQGDHQVGYWPTFLVFIILRYNLPKLNVLLVQDLGYGTVPKRYHGGVTRNAQLLVDSSSPTVGRVGCGCLSHYFIHSSTCHILNLNQRHCLPKFVGKFMYSHYELGPTELIFDFHFDSVRFPQKMWNQFRIGFVFLQKKIKIRFGTSDTHERVK